MVATVKVIEIIGASEESWEQAVRNAVASAAKTLDELLGVDVKAWTAKIGPGGQLVEYHATCKVAFKVKED